MTMTHFFFLVIEVSLMHCLLTEYLNAAEQQKGLLLFNYYPYLEKKQLLPYFPFHPSMKILIL